MELRRNKKGGKGKGFIFRVMEQKQAAIPAVPIGTSAVGDNALLIEPAVIHIDPASIVPLDPDVLPPQFKLQIDDAPSSPSPRGAVSRCSLWASLLHWSLVRYLALASSWYVWLWIYRFTTAGGQALWIVWLCCFPFIQTAVLLVHYLHHRRDILLPKGSIYLCAMPQSCTIPKWPLVDALLVRERHTDASMLMSIIDLIAQAIALFVIGAAFSDTIDPDQRSSVISLAIMSFAVAGILGASTRIGPCCVRGGFDVRDHFSEEGITDEDRLLYLCKLCRAAEQLPMPFTTRSLFIAWVSSVDPLWRREWCSPPPRHIASALLAQSPIALQYLTWLTR
jgi:hypothetical protein